MNEEIKKTFEVGKTYACRSICDSDCIFKGKVLSRTAKTIKMDVEHFGIKTLRISKSLSECYNGIECVKPLGSYSMAPIFRADKELW